MAESKGPDRKGPPRWVWALFLAAIVCAVPYISNLWSERQKELAFAEAMTLSEGEVQLVDHGGEIDESGLDVVLLFQYSGGHPGWDGETDIAQFRIHFEIAVVSDNEKLHIAAGKIERFVKSLWVSCDSPRFETIEEYIERGAELHVSLTQGEREILTVKRILQKKSMEEVGHGPDGKLRLGTMALAFFRNPWPKAEGDEWQLASSVDGQFEVMFPGEAEPWQTKGETEKFGEMKYRHYGTGTGKASPYFGVTFNDYPRDLTEAEIEAELNHLNSVPGIVSRRGLKVDGHQAVEVLTRIGKMHSLARYFVHDSRRLYSVRVEALQDPREHQQTVDRFMNSFRILRD